MYDIIVLGGGPAGLSAAVAARQKGRSVLIVSNAIQGNHLWRTSKVSNYLGMPGVSGAEMLDTFQTHALDMGAELVTGRVIGAMELDGVFYLTVGSEAYEGRKLILAPGVVRENKHVGELALLGRGVSYCTTCDGMLYRNRPVVVVGHSPSAPQEANYLKEIGCQVTYVSPKTPQGLREDIPYVRAGAIEIRGEEQVTGVEADGTLLPCDGAFVLRDAVAPTELFPELEVSNGTVTVDRMMHTNIPGLYAAGDCTGKPYQIAKAVGEGLIAGESAAEELL